MKSLNCKLIVSDFDGTLTDSRNRVGEDVIKAIEEYRSLGGIFAVCTGRILPSVLPRLRAMGLSGLAVASQGSTIADISTGRILREAGLEPADAADICAALEQIGAAVNLYTTYGFYSSLPEDDEYLKKYEAITSLKASRADKPLSLFVRDDGVKAVKVASICPRERRAEILAYLKDKFGGRFEITTSASVLVEISPLGETKGRALKFLCDYYNIPAEQTVAIGDNLNDLSMIEAAGTGVAVANAEEELKLSADFITVSSDEGAVKRVIEQFGYRHE